jgi:hypothetical protein
MDIQHVNAKLFVDGPLEVDGARLIGIFHDWVREQVFDEVLIDVADYRHVPDGPAIMIVGHEADYVIDHTNGRAGLRYNRKASLDGSNVDRFRQAIVSAAKAVRLLQEALGDDAPTFSQTELELTVNDRAIAPNTPETFAALTKDIVSCATAVLGHSQFTLTHHDDPRRLFSVTVVTGKPFDLAKIT